MMNDQPHPDTETAMVDATQIMQTAQNITMFGQLYLMMKHLRSGATEEEIKGGKPIQLKIMDAAGSTMYINSNVIFPALLAEFQRIGDALEKNHIDVSRTLEALEAQFQHMIKATAAGGG